MSSSLPISAATASRSQFDFMRYPNGSLAHGLPGYMRLNPKVSVFVEAPDGRPDCKRDWEMIDIAIRARSVIEDAVGLQPRDGRSIDLGSSHSFSIARARSYGGSRIAPQFLVEVLAKGNRS
jgi:hypothetical protein